jgi:hypothetical protein
MLADIDAICKRTGVWPHVVLSANAQNYQRFTRTVDNMQIPYIVAGNGGHSVARLEEEREPALRVPTALALDGDNVIFENYDDTDFGFLRITVGQGQLRIGYQPVPGNQTTGDSVAVDLKTRRLLR